MAHNNSSMALLVACFHDDDAFKYRAYTVTYLLLCPVAILCNIGALAVFFLQKNRRSSASCVVMMNLALSDGSFSLTLPLRLAYYFRGGVWDFPDWLCRLCVYGFYLNLYTSILFLTLLSALRWLAVNHPLRHRDLVTPPRTLLVCVGVWLFVGVSSVPFLSNGVTDRAGSPRCFEPSSPSSWGRVLILNYVALALGFLLPFLTILACYGRIVRRLTAGARVHGAGRRGSGRSVRLVAMVTATFLLCFLPYHVVRTLHLHAVCGAWPCGLTVALQRAAVVTLCLAASNSVVNPLLYYYGTRTFRGHMRDAHWSLRTGSKRSEGPRLLSLNPKPDPLSLNSDPWATSCQNIVMTSLKVH
ncbi:Cysteinyl leukotriene receptor 1 [Liparis tanakae]|uniref:Cysteinyl leukotriene receptor 1 n=1 Tax=Liparis tanakae TaxID=230148 RepID=A0A4Z2EMQ6_9TELE|nr:Cysteinyl leukotriene receptor 1 [Liparis tanakae]